MSAKTRLTDIAIKRAKPPENGQAEIWDSAIPGFGVRITSKGARSFVLLFRYQGHPRRWTLGRYPALKLADARKMADEALTKLEAGKDPQVEEAAEAATMFAATLDTFFTTYCDQQNRASTAAETRRNMTAIFLKRWKRRTLSSITRADVLSITDSLIENDRPSAARHAFSHARKFFSWCVERGLLEASPMTGLKPPVRAKNRARALSMAELAAVYGAAGNLGYPFGTIVRLLILTGQRRGEVSGMERVEFDKPSKIWTIPAERSKNGRAHALPLGPLARRIVRTTPRLSERFLFPSRGGDETTFSGWSKAKGELDKMVPTVKDWTLHDLRRSMATQLAGLGVAPHIVERILNHAGGTFAGVAGVYNRFEYRDEMHTALRAWEKCLLAEIKKTQSSKN
ncbi:MAG: integrase arm-type DNA-binding domain-containing protein [Hyphomicrobiaceae bacterium]|nr:integrase arm-type DNA-binding domain-containing protein [Hyphomicrobiaceae bacterium]